MIDRDDPVWLKLMSQLKGGVSLIPLIEEPIPLIDGNLPCFIAVPMIGHRSLYPRLERAQVLQPVVTLRVLQQLYFRWLQGPSKGLQVYCLTERGDVSSQQD